MAEQLNPSLQVQINQIDHVLVPPGPLDNSSLRQVPVIRVFGPSSTGKRACVHIHQVYPYFFVDYLGELDAPSVKRYIARLFRSLDAAIAVSLKRDPTSPKSRYVRSIFLVKGIHFYGFHTAFSPFLKILMIDPSTVSRSVGILQSGSVMSTRFRVYESHIGYILQFLADFGLYGCGWLDLDNALQRAQDAQSEVGESNEDGSFPPSPYLSQSRMPLEVDVAAYHIMNRRRLQARNLHNRLLAPTPSLPNEPLVVSVRELWDDERQRRVARGLDPSPAMLIDPSDGSRATGGGWAEEARWWDELRRKMENADHPPFIESPPAKWEGRVMSVFESIEALWDSPFKSWKPASKDESRPEDVRIDSGPDSMKSEELDIDMSALHSQEKSFTEGDHDNADHMEGDDGVPRAFLGEPRVEDDTLEEDDYLRDAEPIASQLNSADKPRLPSDAEHPASQLVLQNDKSLHELLERPSIDDINVPSTPRKVKRAKPEELPSMTTTKKRHLELDSLPETPSKRVRLQLQDEDVADGQQSESSSKPPTLAHKSNLVHSYIPILPNGNGYVYSIPPPSWVALRESLESNEVASRVYTAPFYANYNDAPRKAKEFGGLMFHLKGGNGVTRLKEWELPSHKVAVIPEQNGRLLPVGVGGWQYAGNPPSPKDVKRWRSSAQGEAAFTETKPKIRSQIEGPTQANKYGFKSSLPKRNSQTTVREREDMSILGLEILAPSKNNLTPDPDINEIAVVFFSLQQSDSQGVQDAVLAVQGHSVQPGRFHHRDIQFFSSELELINGVIDLVNELDPDTVVGWDTQISSWGYLQARGTSYGLDVSEFISRAVPGRSRSGGSEEWEIRKTSTFKVIGRQVLNVWRLMRSELTLNFYTFENVVFHVLRRRIPHYSPKVLSNWFHSDTPMETNWTLEHLMTRTRLVLEMLDETDIVTKTAEFARVFGVDFYSVISRGSQFKVESFMFRIAKPESFVLVSPSKADVGRQNAAECIPLIMEPESSFYSSPLVVLDFQSLYPSIMIAYNYCYSTCLGRIKPFQGRNKFGVDPDLQIPDGLVQKLVEGGHVTVAPNGILYVKTEVRRGLLGRMLTELLDTRVMVKQGMKLAKGDKSLERILNARQLGLKFIANVTYGYTSASFSGRMPAVEIADSIVQTGRETLEKAIALINETKKWGARVVYGDTDSMFIYLRGRTKDQAFRIGQDIADTITLMNPAPIKLKFEKVYLPCVLLAKKRYVGYKYENPDDKEPGFDAKGIETVRRDGVLAQRKMVENCLKILFRTQDLSEVKEYCTTMWGRVMENRVPLQEFVFAKEVRMGTYSDKGPPPPGAALAARRALVDPNSEAQYGDRIPYVIARGEGRLVDRAKDPLEMLYDRSIRPDATYYITRVLIPPLARIFNLVGADIHQWYEEMVKTHMHKVDQGVSSSPKKTRELSREPTASPGKVPEDRDFVIEEHLEVTDCIVCGSRCYPGDEGLCSNCSSSPSAAIAGLYTRHRSAESRMRSTHAVCSSCANMSTDDIKCDSLDCHWLYERMKAETDVDDIEELLHEMQLDPDSMEGIYSRVSLEVDDSALSSSDEEAVDDVLPDISVL